MSSILVFLPAFTAARESVRLGLSGPGTQRNVQVADLVSRRVPLLAPDLSLARSQAKGPGRAQRNVSSANTQSSTMRCSGCCRI